MSKPSLLVIGTDHQSELALRRALESVAGVVAAVAGGERVLEEYRTVAPQAVLVAAVRGDESALRQVAVLAGAGARVVVLGPSKDPELILGAMRAGAREFVVMSELDELVRVVSAQVKSSDAPTGLGRLITVFPTRGGVGATTLGVNLAVAMARRGGRVCLLDFNLYLGDVLSFLDLPGTYSISNLIANMGRLDRGLLDASVLRHASGVRVLAQSGKAEEAEGVRAADVVTMLDFLRGHFDHIVIDGIAGFDELSLAVLDASQQIVMVLTQDVPAVRSAKRCLDLFRRIGYDDRKIKLVLNRHHRTSKISAQAIQDAVGLPVAHTVSNDFGSAIESINRGVTLEEVAPRSPLTRDIDSLVPILAGQGRVDEPKTGFLRGLLSRKGNSGTPRAA